jgi:asparagine synthase (glutamine-hydrolysing)
VGKEQLGADRLGTVGVNLDAALALLEEHGRRQADHARPLWTLIVLSEWLATLRSTRRLAT